MKKVLIINIFGIGDVLFTTPLIRNIKAHDKSVSIGFMCNRRVEPLFSNNGDIDRVFVYERDEFKAIQRRSLWSYLRAIRLFIKEIEKENYDTVIDVSLHAFTGYFAWAAGIKNRLGLNYKNRCFFLNQSVPLTAYEGRHVIEYYLDLLRPLGITVIHQRPEIRLQAQDIEWADCFLKEHSLDGKTVIGLVPGGGASWGQDAKYKRWDAENYGKLADKVVEKFSARIILFGDSSEEKLCQDVASRMSRPSVVSCRQSLQQFAALLKRCSLTVMNDGGPLHIAVAAGAKTISVFGPVDERVYGPYPPEHHVVVTKDIACRPCYRAFRRAACDHISCLTTICIDDVIRKVEAFL